MRLEPGRDNLSGASFPPVAQPIKAIVLPPRKCVTCGCDDVVHRVENQFEANGEVRLEHLVTIELRYLKRPEELTPYLKSRGWTAFKHQGRDAMQRFICRPCMQAHREMENEFRQKKSKELRSSSNHDTYYRALCGD